MKWVSLKTRLRSYVSTMVLVLSAVVLLSIACASSADTTRSPSKLYKLKLCNELSYEVKYALKLFQDGQLVAFRFGKIAPLSCRNEHFMLPGLYEVYWSFGESDILIRWLNIDRDRKVRFHKGELNEC